MMTRGVLLLALLLCASAVYLLLFLQQKFHPKLTLFAPHSAPLFSAVRCLRSDSAWERMCHFENVCFDTEDRVFDFFAEPGRLPLLFAGAEGVGSLSPNTSSYEHAVAQLQVPLRLGYYYAEWKDSLLPLRIVPYPINSKNARFHERAVHVVFKSFWAENYGHALGDDVLPVYSLMKHFGVLSTDLQTLMLGNPMLDTPEEFKRAMRFLRELMALISPHPILNVNTDTPFAAQSSAQRHICLANLLAGHGRLGMKSDQGFAWEDFANAALLQAAHLWPTVQKASEDAIKVQSIVILHKAGRRSLQNDKAVGAYLLRVFEVSVTIIDPSTLSLEEQLVLAQNTTVLVTPCGGVSFFGAFLRRSAAMVVLGHWNPDTNTSQNMEDFFWRSNGRLSSVLYYDVLASETTILPPGNSSRGSFWDYRNFGAVTVSLKRMARLVDSALQFAEHFLDLPKPSYGTRLQSEYASSLGISQK